MAGLTIIVDIDGTIASIEHRQHWVRSKPKNWAAFYTNLQNDVPIVPVIEIIKNLWRDHNNTIIFCTGRGTEYREETEKWLSKHVFTTKNLYMRATGDYRDDTIVKKELLDQMRIDGFAPTICFDDRNKVVKMWIEEGLFCLDVSNGKGDF